MGKVVLTKFLREAFAQNIKVLLVSMLYLVYLVRHPGNFDILLLISLCTKMYIMISVVYFITQIWDRKSLESTLVLTGHTGSVLCLQYDENIIVTGSSDSTVRYETNQLTI